MRSNEEIKQALKRLKPTKDEAEKCSKLREFIEEGRKEIPADGLLKILRLIEKERKKKSAGRPKGPFSTAFKVPDEDQKDLMVLRETLGEYRGQPYPDEQVYRMLLIYRELGFSPSRRMMYFQVRDGNYLPVMHLDGIRAVGTSTDRVLGRNKTEFLTDEDGHLTGAVVSINVVNNKTKESGTFYGTALLSEYDTKKNVWASKKHTMIENVAERRAFNVAFQSLLAGIYLPEEFDDEEERPKKGKRIKKEVSSEVQDSGQDSVEK